jgi:FXSXX-COOH protein
MDELSTEQPGPNDTSPLIDLSKISLDDVARLDDSVLAHSLYRILGDEENPAETILASFSASL